MSEETNQTIESTEGDSSTEWFSRLPEELQNDKTLQRHKNRTLDQFATDFLNVKKQSTSALRVPKEDAKPEEWDEVYNKLGRPAKANEYTLPKFEVPEGMEFKQDDDLMKSFTEAAHKSGLNNTQFQSLAQIYFNQRLKESQNGGKTIDAMAELKKVWGSEETVNENHMVALRALENYFPKDIQDQLIDELKDKPVFIQGLYHLGKKFGESKMSEGDTTTVSIDDQITELDLQINEIRSNPMFGKRRGDKDFNPTEFRNLKREMNEKYEKRQELKADLEKERLQAKFGNR